MATWSWLVALLSIHLATNYAAVCAVSMRTLNRQRANIIFSTLIDNDVVLTQTEVSKQERIFERDGALRWGSSSIIGYAKIGVRLSALFEIIGRTHSATFSVKDSEITLTTLETLFRREKYMLWWGENANSILIVLKDTASNVSQLKAWIHALLTARHVHLDPSSSLTSSDSKMSILRETLEYLNVHFDGHIDRLRKAGWDLDTAALGTRSGFRLTLSSAAG